MGPTAVPEGVSVVFDNNLKDASSVICGANEKDYHLVGNSFVGIEADYHDLVAVQEGDLCACCGEPMRYTKGIEAGHIFQLGTQYSEPLGANFLDENGKSQPMVMGTYGIGVSRLLAAIIEQNHDEKGCIWSRESAPFAVEIIVAKAKKEEQMVVAQKLYDELQSKGVTVLLDDRADKKTGFGVKIKDFELIGIPYAVVIGNDINQGKVELITRDGLIKEELTTETLLETILEKLI